MSDNQNSTDTIQKLLSISLKDWVVIVGVIVGISTYYVNTAGDNAKRTAQMETITSNLAEIKSLQKEMQAEQRSNHKELDKRTTDNAVEIKVLQQRMNDYDKRR